MTPQQMSKFGIFYLCVPKWDKIVEILRREVFDAAS